MANIVADFMTLIVMVCILALAVAALGSGLVLLARGLFGTRRSGRHGGRP